MFVRLKSQDADHGELFYGSKMSRSFPHLTSFSFPPAEHMVPKHAAPTVGSSIPTLVSRGADPLNGAASKRPHSPTLEEQAKRLKETEKARIHIA